MRPDSKRNEELGGLVLQGQNGGVIQVVVMIVGNEHRVQLRQDIGSNGQASGEPLRPKKGYW